ncbi:Response regulator receiver protein [Pseudodesulfovibrio profundus]|uniref:Response regulator receiver protein n=1 Tax=Pseudodesulfovibrio profundus TaxID=57320 RepID=A0A2C8FBX6_9BACT|nr:response regulator [Pseudodesulfovibrio profundus]SOB59937.1 Response regulator receiver protein [Pseudodesulfovibrio profundus]
MKKILIAEDDRISQKLAAKIIEDMGHMPFVSPNGEHAYEALMNNSDFDLLITDIMMPKMDGQQLIKTLRGDQQFMTFPIIIMSAVVGVSDISNLLELGASLFLPKPLEKDEVVDYVNRCISKQNCHYVQK